MATRRNAASQIAQQDTPEAVQVPNSLAGVIVWAVGRFGSGIVIAIACGYALSVVYKDWREDMSLWRDTVRATNESATASAKGMEKIVDELSKNSEAVVRLAEEAHAAHNKKPLP